jgi:hypothetical protein
LKCSYFWIPITWSQIPPKLIKTQRFPKNLPTKNIQHYGILNSQQPTLKNTRNTQHPRHPYEIENIIYILHLFHNSPLIFYYAYVTSSKVSKYTNWSLSNLMKHPKWSKLSLVSSHWYSQAKQRLKINYKYYISRTIL